MSLPYPLGQCHAALRRIQRWYLPVGRATSLFCLTLTVRVILLGRLRLALRQYNLTLQLLKLGLQFVQLTIRLFHDRRHVGERFTIGRHFSQLLGAGLYLQLLQPNSDHIHTYFSSFYGEPFVLHDDGCVQGTNTYSCHIVRRCAA